MAGVISVSTIAFPSPNVSLARMGFAARTVRTLVDRFLLFGSSFDAGGGGNRLCVAVHQLGRAGDMDSAACIANSGAVFRWNLAGPLFCFLR
jgi:hypothetical protein